MNEKPSGTSWIDTIPATWNIERMKNQFVFSKGLNITKADLVDDGVAVISYGQIHAKNNTGTTLSPELLRYISPENIAITDKSLLHKGDIVFADTSEDYDGLGNAAYMDGDNETYAGYHTIIARPKNIDYSKYFAYLFKSDAWRVQLRVRASGIKVFSVTQRMLNDVTLIMPEKNAIKPIFSFLDDRCYKIDSIIAEAKASIEEYKELKQAVIYEAVTKGLDKNAPMKDSGVEWIGESPLDWNIIRVKHLLTEINNRSEQGIEEPLSVSQVLGIVPSSEISVANPTSSYIGQKVVEQHDMVFNRLKAHLGVFFESNYKGLVSPDYAVFRGNKRINPKFLEYLFHTPAAITEFKKYITGVGDGLRRLYTDDLFNISVSIPSIEIQNEIISKLNLKVQKMDAMISEKQSLIQDLESYKKSLIYEVVTGKRKVVE
ncbi:hypothetical protein [uncultured Anaerovibrio sp.]|uniref:hypothetical protein n=1 Tax=uncultured Anaerovibrio sp. TaxID=361586 RepID=UPI002618A630|nr:hypothetical protein [uncultured Anaerovibrio sp.]